MTSRPYLTSLLISRLRARQRLAMWGVAIGLAVMIVSLSVVSGFKQCVRDKVTGVAGHVAVMNRDALYGNASPIDITEDLRNSLLALDGVESVSPYCTKMGMLKTDISFLGVQFRGIDEAYDLSFLRTALVDGAAEGFAAGESSGRLLISETVADKLRLEAGSRVFAYFFDGEARARRFTVEGVFRTNFAEHDRAVVYTDLHTTQRLLGYEPTQMSGAEVRLESFSLIDDGAEQIGHMLRGLTDSHGESYVAPAITELYPNIFSWLSLLDLNVVVILSLMMAVAAFTAVSGLLIMVLERVRFIGVMKALGATDGLLRRTFLGLGAVVVLRGVALGIALGVGLCLLQQFTGFARLDETTYYVPAVPVDISWLGVLALAAGVTLLTLLVLLIPAHVVARISPARSISFE